MTQKQNDFNTISVKESIPNAFDIIAFFGNLGGWWLLAQSCLIITHLVQSTKRDTSGSSKWTVQDRTIDWVLNRLITIRKAYKRNTFVYA